MSVLTTVGSSVVHSQRKRVEQYGDQLLFYVKALAWTPVAIKKYRREISHILA
jgi:phospholipid/cholesterol/gamma-HCH transport system permease protein